MICKLYVSKLLFSTVIVSNYNLILSAFFQPKILPVLPFDGPEKSILGSSDTLLIEMIPKIKMSCQYFLMFQFIIYLSSHQEWVSGSFTKFLNRQTSQSIIETDPATHPDHTYRSMNVFITKLFPKKTSPSQEVDNFLLMQIPFSFTQIGLRKFYERSGTLKVDRKH